MYILHVHWQPSAQPTESGLLHFWAEIALAEQPPRYKRGTKRILPHPFCVEAKALRQILLPLTGATVRASTATILKRLGQPAFLNEDLEKLLGPVYRAMIAKALAIYHTPRSST